MVRVAALFCEGLRDRIVSTSASVPDWSSDSNMYGVSLI